jgi:hypothetical protein
MKPKRTKREEQSRRDVILVGVLFFICIALFAVSMILGTTIRQLTMSGLGIDSAQSSSADLPTSTPKPTATPTPTPTNTPTPKPTRASASAIPPTRSENTQTVGIGISREDIQAVYQKEGFTFEQSGTTDEFTGKSSNRLAAISLIGPQNNLTRVAIIVHISKDNPQVLSQNLQYVSKMIKLIAPQWSNGTVWLYASITKLASAKSEPREEITFYNNIRMILRMTLIPDLLLLTCEAK